MKAGRSASASPTRSAWVTTGERLTAETFARYRKEGGRHHPARDPGRGRASGCSASGRDEFASDGPIEKSLGHPRGRRHFARVLGH